jgi:hypothetical protein
MAHGLTGASALTGSSALTGASAWTGSTRLTGWTGSPKPVRGFGAGVLTGSAERPPSPKPLEVVVQPARRDTAERGQPRPETTAHDEHLPWKEAAGLPAVPETRPPTEPGQCARRAPAPDDLIHRTQAWRQAGFIVAGGQGPDSETLDEERSGPCPCDQDGDRTRLHEGERPRLTASTRRPLRRSQPGTLGGLWHAEVSDNDATLESRLRLAPPLVEEPMAPAKGGALVDVQPRCSGPDAEAAVDAP